jgi:hypothetical protein
MMAAAALGACVPHWEDAGAQQALARAKTQEKPRDDFTIHWGKPVDGLVLGIAVPRGPYLLPPPSSIQGRSTALVEPYVKNVSLQIPADCDGSVRIMSAMFDLETRRPGGGVWWGCRQPATAPLAQKLLDGKTRHIQKLSASFNPLALAKETGAYAELFPASSEAENQTHEWIAGRLTLSLRFSNGKGELVVGSWSGTLEARAPVDLAPLEEDAREQARVNVDGEE